MTASVAWTLLLRVRSREKAEKELERVAGLLGCTLQIGQCERYWKDETLWRCEIVTPLESSGAAEQIAKCLVLANRLARGWHVVGPRFEADGRIGNFWGIFDVRHAHTSLSSLTWVEFAVIAGP